MKTDGFTAPPELDHCDPELVRLAFNQQRSAFSKDPYPSYVVRLDRLARLQRLLEEEGDTLVSAIDQDFGGRSRTESQLTEIFPGLEGIRHARRNLKRWMKPESRQVSFWFWPAKAQLAYQPLGVVGIVVPWNYPLFLAVAPLTAALAAGNRVMLKMSEFAPVFSAAFSRCVARHFSRDEVFVIEGDASIGRKFVEQPFDHLLFTGSSAVGRQVLRAAAENLTPVTLELGGKSPAVQGKRFDIALAAKRIVYSKLLNAGQTCVAPDYVLVPASELEGFISAAVVAARQFYGDGAADYTNIISGWHYERLDSLAKDAHSHGARVIQLLGTQACSGRKFGPLILAEVTTEMKVMQEEIFGPILPVVGYDSLDEAITFINQYDRPLALYVFSQDQAEVDQVLMHTHAGGVAVNDCLLQVAQDDLPFGGVGASGMGRYHGVDGFLRFSNARSEFRQSRFSSAWLMYPPYGKRARWLLKLMLRRWR